MNDITEIRINYKPSVFQLTNVTVEHSCKISK